MTKENMNITETEEQATDNKTKKPKSKRLIASIVGGVVLIGAIGGGAYA